MEGLLTQPLLRSHRNLQWDRRVHPRDPCEGEVRAGFCWGVLVRPMQAAQDATCTLMGMTVAQNWCRALSDDSSDEQVHGRPLLWSCLTPSR